MGVTITEVGHIYNEAGPKDNPRETEYFENYIARVVDSTTSIVNWTIAGDIPVGISIDANGVISGVVAGMWNQPSCVPKKPHVYPEYDCRYYPDMNGRFVDNYYDYFFTTTCHWVDSKTGPGTTSVGHMIRLVKWWHFDIEILYQEILDGSLGREPYHCSYPGPSTKEQCELINGEWDEDLQICSIGIPKDAATCESVGGIWENGKCNMKIIKTRAECELVGGTWTKNTLTFNGVTYDNSADYLAAFFEANPDSLSF